MKNILIIGATGFVGPHLVQEGLDRVYHITAVSRHPEKVLFNHPNLTTIKGDVFIENEIVDIIKGHDAVISAYNSGWDNPNIYDDNTRGYRAVQDAVKKAGVKRFFVIGGAGSLETEKGIQLVDSENYPAEYRAGAASIRDYLNVIRKENELDWTFVSPAISMSPAYKGIRTGTYTIGTDKPVFNEKGESIISAEDLAVAVFDEIENNNFIKKRFTVGYK